MYCSPWKAAGIFILGCAEEGVKGYSKDLAKQPEPKLQLQILAGLGQVGAKWASHYIQSNLCESEPPSSRYTAVRTGPRYTAVSKKRCTALDRAATRSASESGFSPVN